MSDFPIQALIPALKSTLKSQATVIIEAPPGAGKSTILPIALLNEPWLKNKKIILLEPRRIAAKSVALRMAELLDEKIGETIGYRIRFEKKISASTRIEVVTEGMLTRMLQDDNALENVGAILFDEFHERNLHGDLALALTLECQSILREDLRLLIMSATLDGETISKKLGDIPILKSEGRQYPIQYHYFEYDKFEPLPVQVSRLIKKSVRDESGSILVFLPGKGEIMQTLEILENASIGIDIYPLHGDLAFEKQQEAIFSTAFRKIILATSIAETSLTIEGISVVIDAGFSRVPTFDVKTGLTTLETIKVTKDVADQRAGRAGRLGPGTCYRLWSESTNHHLLPHRQPEITNADLATVVLELTNWGISNIESLNWITPPLQANISQAKSLLQNLEAIDKNEKITEKGKTILKLPTHPRIAHLLIEGKEKKILHLATDIAALLEEKDPLPNELSTNLTLRIELLRKWRNKIPVSGQKFILERIEKLAKFYRDQFSIAVSNEAFHPEKAGLLIAAAYPERIAKQQDNDQTRYRLANGKKIKLSDQDSLLHEPWISIAHADTSRKEGKVFLAAPLDLKDIEHYCITKETVQWDYQNGKLIAALETKIGEITLKQKPLDQIDASLKETILNEVVRKERELLFNRSDSFTQFLARVETLKLWSPETKLPNLNFDHLLDHPENWLSPYYSSIKNKDDFYKMDLFTIVQSICTWEELNLINHLMPEKIKVPSQFEIPINYFNDGNTPVLAVRIQELFGLTDSPVINNGKNKIMLHLLSPGYKPVQITQDLRSFWDNTYPEIRKELKIRYPKHHWPEDPWTAEAVRGVIRKNKPN